MVAGVNHDGLVPSKAPGGSASDFMAHAEQVTLSFGRKAKFERYLSAILRLLSGGFGQARMLDARSIAGFLQIHPKIDQVQDNLNMTLRLHLSAHHPKTD